MSDELGTCLYDATPHQRITFKMAVLSAQPFDHCCEVWWQPLPTPSETPNEPVLARGPLCGGIYPATRSGCTCGHESGHAGKHKCGGCSFEWESLNPITAMAEPESAPTLEWTHFDAKGGGNDYWSEPFTISDDLDNGGWLLAMDRRHVDTLKEAQDLAERLWGVLNND